MITAGVVAADQLEILERLTWQRSMFPSAAIAPARWGGAATYWDNVEAIASPGVIVTDADIQAMLRSLYKQSRATLENAITPLPRVIRDRHCPPGTLYLI